MSRRFLGKARGSTLLAGMAVGIMLCIVRVHMALAGPTADAICDNRNCVVINPPPRGPITLKLHYAGHPRTAPDVVLHGRRLNLARCGDDFCLDLDAAQIPGLVVGGYAIKIARVAPRGSGRVIYPTRVPPPEKLLRLGIRTMRDQFELGGEPTPAPPPRHPPDVSKPSHDPVDLERSGQNNKLWDNRPPPERPAPVHPEVNGPPVVAPAPSTLDDLSVPEVLAIGTTDALDCSAVAIAPSFMVTARHCATATRAVYGANVDQPLAEFRIDRVVVPPDPDVDLALLHTTEPMGIGLHPRRHSHDWSPPFGQVRVVGFGISDFATRTGYGIKRQMLVSVQGWGCDGARPAITGCLPGLEMVLPPDQAHDTCNGDSGGAVFEPMGKSWRLLAITSRAVAGTTEVCGSGGIYVRIDALADWIDRVIGGGT